MAGVSRSGRDSHGRSRQVNGLPAAIRYGIVQLISGSSTCAAKVAAVQYPDRPLLYLMGAADVAFAGFVAGATERGAAVQCQERIAASCPSRDSVASSGLPP